MRQAAKADLAKFLLTENVFLSSEEGAELMKHENCVKVLDGGALLHRVQWTKKESFANIMKGNHSHVRNLTGNGSKGFIVFDGYGSNSTKDHCHKKRSPVESLQLNFTDLSKPLLCKKYVFLANTVNNIFFRGLGISLQQYEKIEVQHTTDDADRAIFIKCMECLEHSDTILIGDDTDLIVLCLHFYRIRAPTRSLYIYRPSSKTYVDTRKVIQQWPNNVLENMLAIHAASRCDTVSVCPGSGRRN